MKTWSGLGYPSVRRAKQLARSPSPLSKAEALAMRAEHAAFLAELKVIRLRVIQDVEKQRERRR